MMILALTESEQEQTHISDASKGTGYICALCKSRVCVIKGDRKRHHYRHITNHKKAGGNGETDLHKLAKEIIQISRTVTLQNEQPLTFDRVETEVYMNKQIKVDLVGYIGQRRYVIEIRVTHAVNRQKIEILERLNVDTLELDLSSWHRSCPSYASPVGIAQLINRFAPRRWLVRYRRFPRLYRFWYSVRALLLRKTHTSPLSTRTPYQLGLPI